MSNSCSTTARPRGQHRQCAAGLYATVLLVANVVISAVKPKVHAQLSIPITYSLIRYLAAKKSVDDRALNWQVWQRLVAALPRATTEQPLRILEVGAGIGSMVERLLAGDLLTHASYTAIDQAPTLLAEA